MRILLDPVAADGGSTPAPAAAATATPTPTPSPEPPPAPTIPLSVEEFQRLRGAEAKLAEIELAQKAALEAKEAERLKAMAEKGQAEEALSQLRTAKEAEIAKAVERAQGLEAQILDGERRATLANSLLGAEFVSEEAAQQAREILESKFETTRDATGKAVTREKTTGRPAADVVKEWLGSRAASHFLKADARGGTGASGGARPTPTPSPTDKPPQLGDALLMLEKERRSAPVQAHYGLAR